MKSAKLTARATAREALRLGLMPTFACLLPLCAFVSNSEAAAGVQLLPTKMPDVFVYSQPDSQFDAISASDEDLASAGFPPVRIPRMPPKPTSTGPGSWEGTMLGSSIPTWLKLRCSIVLLST